MRCLFVFEGEAGPILPIVPLAQATRIAGHEVVAAACADAMPLLLNSGILATVAPRLAPKDYGRTPDGKPILLPDDPRERAVVVCSIGARMAVDAYHDLLGLAREWRPDIVVGGPLAYAAPLLSAELGVPLAAVEFGMAEPRNRHIATVEALLRLGFTDVPKPDLSLVLCPKSIRPADAATGDPIRYIPYTPARPVEPWMYAGKQRPRVWVSAGSRVSTDNALDDLTEMIHAVAELDVDLLIATPDDVVGRLGTLPPNARAGWLPFDVLAQTCDLAVHHGGGSTMLGCVAAAVPQVVIPFFPGLQSCYEPIRDYGAAKLLTSGDNTPATVFAACQEVLTEPSYRAAAIRLCAEMADAPNPAAIVTRLEETAKG